MRIHRDLRAAPRSASNDIWVYLVTPMSSTSKTQKQKIDKKFSKFFLRKIFILHTYSQIHRWLCAAPQVASNHIWGYCVTPMSSTSKTKKKTKN